MTVCDPLPDVAERVRAGLREIAPTLAQLGLPVDDLTDSTDGLRFDPDAASAVAGADVVQENGPERLRGQTAAVVDDRGRRPGERPARLLLLRDPRIGHEPSHAPTRPADHRPSVQPATPGPPGRGRAVTRDRSRGGQSRGGVLPRHGQTAPGALPRDPRVCRQPAASRPVPRGGPPRHPRGGHRAGAGCGRDQFHRDALGGGRSVSDLPFGGWTWRHGRLPRAPGSGLGGPVGDPGPAAPGCRHNQAPHHPGRALRRNRGGAGSPSRSGADPPDASPGRTRGRGTAGAMSHQRPARS